MIKALFLDRDGIINHDHGYVHKKEDFQFINGIFDLCKVVQAKGFKIFIVTNQSGIARGYFDEKTFFELTDWMIQEFKKEDVIITDYVYCKELDSSAPCRKPNPGMFLKLIEKYKIDPKLSIAVGDKEADMEASHNAGIETRYFVKSKYNVPNNTKANKIFNDIKELAKHIKTSL